MSHRDLKVHLNKDHLISYLRYLKVLKKMQCMSFKNDQIFFQFGLKILPFCTQHFIVEKPKSKMLCYLSLFTVLG